jgi:predicted anti-sigma-YlaC factor YlaD
MFRSPRALVRGLALCVMLSALAGCGMVMNKAASALSKTGSSGTSDDDPDLVEAALPFELKLQEGLLESVPHNKDLLLSTCKLATQFGYAFIQTKADLLDDDHHDEIIALRARALNMYLRGRRYCFRAMDERFKGTSDLLVKKAEIRDGAIKRFSNKKDVELLYWTATSWGAAISLAKDKPAIVINHPAVRALAAQALSLDESWNSGAIHEMLITLDSLPDYLGGDKDRARKHFERAIELQHHLSPGPYVALATGVSQAEEKKDEFKKLLEEAIAIDPEKDPANRLVTLLTQRRARALLARIDQIFTGAPS